jgi:hypothetical protein
MLTNPWKSSGMTAFEFVEAAVHELTHVVATVFSANAW